MKTRQEVQSAVLQSHHRHFRAGAFLRKSQPPVAPSQDHPRSDQPQPTRAFAALFSNFHLQLKTSRIQPSPPVHSFRTHSFPPQTTISQRQDGLIIINSDAGSPKIDSQARLYPAGYPCGPRRRLLRPRSHTRSHTRHGRPHATPPVHQILHLHPPPAAQSLPGPPPYVPTETDQG